MYPESIDGDLNRMKETRIDLELSVTKKLIQKADLYPMPVTLAHLKSQIKSEREDVGFQENPEFETSTKYLSQSRSYEGQFHTKKVKSVDFEVKLSNSMYRKTNCGKYSEVQNSNI